MRWRRSDLAPLRRLLAHPPSLPVYLQVQPSSLLFAQSVSSRTLVSCTLEFIGTVTTHLAPEKWKWNAALTWTAARIRENPENPCSLMFWSRAFRSLTLSETMGSTPFNALICESDNFGIMYIANTTIVSLREQRQDEQTCIGQPLCHIWPQTHRQQARSFKPPSELQLSKGLVGTVSVFFCVCFFFCAIQHLRALLRLKGPARRPHRGPTGKKKLTAPKKKSARRREVLFERTERATTHTIPLMAVQHQTESNRAETLAWVSFLLHNAQVAEHFFRLTTSTKSIRINH